MLWLSIALLVVALCCGYAFHALQRARRLRSEGAGETDPFELGLLEREHNLMLGLARRNVRALGRVSIVSGTALGIQGLIVGGREYYIVAASAFVAGVLGWVVCGEAWRRIGSLADSWRAETNAANRRGKRSRQGVDPSERTG